jgi:outer membrane protein OmpA-like peptidoglycan-associated protein
MMISSLARSLAVLLLAGAGPAFAQTATPDAQPASGAPAPLVVHFESGSSSIRPEDTSVLDHASRAYSDGKPIVMILTGSADRVGKPGSNLTLSQKRAIAVLHALLDRGIPAERFQILAKGETELAVPTDKGIAEAENRRVEITWR